MTIRIVVADDHKMMRKSVCDLLGAESDLEVIGEAVDGDEAVAKVLEMKPDVVVLDVAMPKQNGIQAAGKLRAALPELKILMLSLHGSASHVEHAMAAGADGYLVKADAADEVVDAVREVHAGRRYFSSQLEGKGGTSPS